MKMSGQTPFNNQALPAHEMEMLKALWIETAEEAIAAAAALPISADSAAAVTLRKAAASASLAASPIAPERLAALALPRTGGGLGCLVDPRAVETFRHNGRLHAVRPLPLGAFEGRIPRAVRLSDRMPPVRNQGERGTCVAFASVALREYLLPEQAALSEQFLYWACKELDGDPNPGTFLHTAMSAFAEYGVCPSTVWPYNPSPAEIEGQGPPPRGARDEARRYRLPSTRTVEPSLALHVKHVLAGRDGTSGMPVVIGTLVFDSWYRSAETHRTGKITLPFPGEDPVGGHAWCVVGYADDDSVPGGGYFIVRNSWGEEWAPDSPEAPGHALMPYAYFERCADEAFTGPEPAAPPETSALPEEWRPYVRTLEQNARDADGLLLKGGTRVLFNPRDPGVFREDTDKNRTAFLQHNHTWTTEARTRAWFPAKDDWPTEFSRRLARAQGDALAFHAAIEENLKTSRRTLFPEVNLPLLATLMPFQPRIRRIGQSADLSADLVRLVLHAAGVPEGVEPPSEWAEAVAAANVMCVYTLRSLPADVQVVAAFVTPLLLRPGTPPACLPPAADLLREVRDLADARTGASPGRSPVYTFFSLASAQPWPEGQKGVAAGDACVLLSHRNEGGFWLTATPPFFATRTSFRNFVERVSPVTRQERVSRVKTTVDEWLSSGYQANITVEKVVKQTGYRQTTVRDAFLTMQEVSPDKYRVERLDNQRIAIRRCRPGEQISLTARSFSRSFFRRHALLFLSAAVGVSGWVLRSQIKLDGTLGFLLLVFLVYVTGIIQTKINRRASDEKES